MLLIIMAYIEHIVQRSTLTIVIVIAVSVLASAGKGFNANGEKDNGKRKFRKKSPILVLVRNVDSMSIYKIPNVSPKKTLDLLY